MLKSSFIFNFFVLNKKALVVFSGGLDSILVVELLQREGFEVTALTFVTPFFDAEKAKETVLRLNIKHIVSDITAEHLKLVKNPPHGYGKNLNPCLDCHGLMFRLAGEIALQENCQIVATGEVVGQRPFSQNKQALRRVEKIAGMENRILRPLSAQILIETDYEKTGMISRMKMLDLSGKSRKPQLNLAQKWGIENFPTPAGGCLLTDPGFSKRLQDLWDHHPEASIEEINLLKAGRQFWHGENKILIGRDKDDNFKISKLCNPSKMILLKLKDLPGPLGLIYLSDYKNTAESLKFAAEKIKYYALKTRNSDKVSIIFYGQKKGEICV